MNLKKIFVIVLITIIIGCSPTIFDKSKLHLAKKDFKIKNITFRTDGYYYTVKTYKTGENKSLDNQYNGISTCSIMPIIFYNDGYVRKSEFIHGTRPYTTEQSKKEAIEESLKELEESFINRSFHVQSKNSIWDWGMYNQKSSNVLIQYYYNHYGDYNLIDYSGQVINDTTIIFNKRLGDERPHKKNKELKEIYKFRKFHMKPDSTNYIRTNIQRFG